MCYVVVDFVFVEFVEYCVGEVDVGVLFVCVGVEYV